MTFYDMKALLEADRALKPGGTKYDDDSVMLKKYYEDSAQTEIRSFLRTLGMGDSSNPHPLSMSTMRRVIDEQSVVYSTPPVRALEIGGLELEDDAREMRDLAKVFEKMLYQVHWQTIDELRNLYRQVAVLFSESGPHGCVQMRIFEPFNLRRRTDARARDIMDADEAVAFQISAAEEPENELFELWMHEDDGTWRMNVIDGVGQMSGVQPYGDDGVSPFGTVAPFMMVYDELPRNRAYLPMNANRLGYAKNLAAVLNDIMYLIKLEAHTSLAITSDDTRGVPTETGPGKIFVLPGDATINTLATSPKIKDSAEQLDRVLRYWANSESLPSDAFQETKTPVTGTALKVHQLPLARRRARQVPMVAPNEARAYEKLVVVHNTYADFWGLPMLPDDATLKVTAASTWQPIDQKEMQEVYFKDISVGGESLISYLQVKDGLTRTQAIEKYDRVQRDRELYPVFQQQNPAAVTDGGPHAATGPNGAQKVDGAFNPEIETSTEGASVSDAVRVALDTSGDPN